MKNVNDMTNTDINEEIFTTDSEDRLSDLLAERDERIKEGG